MKQKLEQSLAAKIVAFALCVVTAVVGYIGIVSGTYLWSANVYGTPGVKTVMDDTFRTMARADVYQILYGVRDGNVDAAKNYCQGTNFGVYFTDQYGATVSGGTFYENLNTAFQYTFEQEFATERGDLYDVDVYINDQFPYQDKYAAAYAVTFFLFEHRYAVFATGLISAAVSIACFVFLLASAGRKKGVEGVAAGYVARRVPFDLFTILFLIVEGCVVNLTIGTSYLGGYPLATWTPAVLMSMLGLTIALLYFMNVAVRVKLGGVWKNSLIYKACAMVHRHLHLPLNGLADMFRNLPLIWRTAVFCVLFVLLSLLAVVVPGGIGLWLLGMVILVPTFLYIAYMLRCLQEGSEALARGDLSYQINTYDLLWDFKDAGENLNQIAAGMTKAVDERLKSERFKTELITNVSHDIKTPLTSIINYADLIGKEPCDNEAIKDYAIVLLRQSERLKKLIEDLVDASKASSGALDLTLEPCEVGVLLAQTAGEYSQKLEDQKLLLIVKQPEEPVWIMADGRQLWRVFDNLMNNICKYALGGTRVYLVVELQEQAVSISFKNTSAAPLDVPPEDLLERFVRGDLSRHSEGNGLGLAIAQSLTEQQGGRLSLSVDADLFKVTLHFSALPM